MRPETEERVHLAIRELGFRRNDAARSLRQRHKPRTLGLVIGDVGNPFYSAIARGVEQVLRRRGMLLITGSSDEDPEQERDLIRELLERRVDGLIVAPAATDHRYLLPDMAHGVPIVFIDRPPGRSRRTRSCSTTPAASVPRSSTCSSSGISASASSAT